jgi:23S rRNA pseudouridine2605 synthase
MFDAIGHSVIRLSRVRIGNLDDKRLKVGECRRLTPEEVRKLMRRKRKPPASRRQNSK